MTSLARNPLRRTKVRSTPDGTQWLTAKGGVFIEPVQRPDASEDVVQLQLTLVRSDYRLLEVLHDDVAGYINRLIRTHCDGLIKSAAHNAKVRNNGNTHKG